METRCARTGPAGFPDCKLGQRRADRTQQGRKRHRNRLQGEAQDDQSPCTSAALQKYLPHPPENDPRELS